MLIHISVFYAMKKVACATLLLLLCAARPILGD